MDTEEDTIEVSSIISPLAIDAVNNNTGEDQTNLVNVSVQDDKEVKAGDILAECDELRDSVLPNFGVDNRVRRTDEKSLKKLFGILH